MATETTTTTRCVACGAAIAPGAPHVAVPAPGDTGATWFMHTRAADCVLVILASYERKDPNAREGTLQTGSQADQLTP